MARSTKLILLTRSPFEPAIKTRLAACCSEAQRRSLLHAFVLDTLATIHETALFQPAEIGILTASRWVAPPGWSGPEFGLPDWVPATALQPQAEGDLGHRQMVALGTAYEQGYDRVVIIGSDSPTLRPRHFHQALERLDNSELVLGPSDDGGYYLLGCNFARIGTAAGFSRPHLEGPLTQLFANVAWSTDQVFEAVLENARDLNWKVRLLPEHYDVDTCANLAQLARELQANPEIAPHTGACLTVILGTPARPAGRPRRSHCH